MIRRRVGGLLLVSGLAVPFAAGCAKATAGVNLAAFDDAQVTTRVKTALINDPAIGTERIDVETSGGVVTLSGRVSSKEAEQKAMTLAGAARGVTGVKSTLEIQP